MSKITTVSNKKHVVQPVHHVHEVKQPGLFSSVVQGFGLGAGQSLAFNLFRSDPVVHHKHESKEREYVQCMKEKQDAEACKQYLD